MKSAATETLESSVIPLANKATVAGSVVTVFGGLTASDIGVYAGIVIGALGLVVSWYFKHQADKRDQADTRRYEEAHAAYMGRLKSDSGWVGEPPVPHRRGEV